MTAIQKDLSLLKALEYLVNAQFGYVNALKNNPYFNDDLICDFCSMSFMRIGWTEQKQTWSITQFGRDYYRSVRK